MATQESTAENKAKIILDEANLAFCETAERKDEAGKRELAGSSWEEGRMDGEFDETDFNRILEWQLKIAEICDANPDLEEKSADLFQKVNADNADECLKEALDEPNIRDLAKISIAIFLLRFPNIQSFINKGHPLVLAADEYMLENSSAQNWQDYKNISEEIGLPS